MTEVERLREKVAELEEQVVYLRSELGIAIEASATDDMIQAFRLTPFEGLILMALRMAYPRVMTRATLIDFIPPSWRKEDAARTLLDVHVHRIRHKMGQGVIRTVYAVGFRLTPEGLSAVDTAIRGAAPGSNHHPLSQGPETDEIFAGAPCGKT